MITCAIIGMWQVARSLRWINVAAGVWLLVSPWLFGFQTLVIVNEMLVGALAIAMGLIEGKRGKSYGGGWKALAPPG